MKRIDGVSLKDQLQISPGERQAFTFCESTWSSGLGLWCIRKPSEVGPKFGGGIDTSSLCEHVKAGNGWDLEVRITEHHLSKNTCKKCLTIYREQTK